MRGAVEVEVEVKPPVAEFPPRLDDLSEYGRFLLRMSGTGSRTAASELRRGLRQRSHRGIAFIAEDRVIWLGDDWRTIESIPRSEPLNLNLDPIQEPSP